jgi:hypothetical protein
LHAVLCSTVSWQILGTYGLSAATKLQLELNQEYYHGLEGDWKFIELNQECYGLESDRKYFKLNQECFGLEGYWMYWVWRISVSHKQICPGALLSVTLSHRTTQCTAFQHLGQVGCILWSVWLYIWRWHPQKNAQSTGLAGQSLLGFNDAINVLSWNSAKTQQPHETDTGNSSASWQSFWKWEVMQDWIDFAYDVDDVVLQYHKLLCDTTKWMLLQVEVHWPASRALELVKNKVVVIPCRVQFLRQWALNKFLVCPAKQKRISFVLMGE